VDCVDLYQLHVVDPLTPVEDTLAELDRQVQRGTVRHIGWSNVPAYRLALALGHSAVHGLARFATVQARYNLLHRAPEVQTVPLCADTGVGLIAYNPLAGGLLAGRHRGADGPVTGRFALPDVGERYRGRYWHRPAFAAADRLRELAAEAGLAPATLATAWVASRPGVTCTLIGVSAPAQLDALLAAADVEPAPDVEHALDRATRIFRLSDAPF
jgi:1-deoxyxylulose-5-phosphate synthase